MKSNNNNIVYDSVAMKGFYTIKPELNNFKFQRYIDKDLENELSGNVCDSADEQITYTVKHLTPSFISIVKSTYYRCDGGGLSYYEDGINLLLYKQNLYLVEAQYSKKLGDEIMSFLKKNLDSECLKDSQLYKEFNMCFENGKAYVVNPLHNVFCDTNVEMDFTPENFKFTYVSY